MASSYIPLQDSDPNRNRFGFRDNSGEGIPSNQPPFNASRATNNAQLFGIKKQTLLLISKTYLRCLVTTIFVAFVLATLKTYQNKNSFSSDQKTNFNVIITALSLCLGLNFFVGQCPCLREFIEVSLTFRMAGLIQRPCKRLALEVP